MMMLVISLCLFCLAAQVQAFGTAPAPATTTRRACFASRTGIHTGVSLKEVQQSPTRLWSQSPEESEKEEEKEVNPRLEGTQYPIDIPSPILLATSMILAILSTGMLCCVVLCYMCVERWRTTKAYRMYCNFDCLTILVSVSVHILRYLQHIALATTCSIPYYYTII